MATDEPDHMNEDELWKALPSSEGFRKGDILGNLGKHKMIDDDYDQALALIAEAIVEFTKVDAGREVGYCTFLLAQCKSVMKEHAQARDLFLSVLQMPAMHGWEHEMAQAASGAADEFHVLQDIEAALEMTYVAIETLEMAGGRHAHFLSHLFMNLSTRLAHFGGRQNEVLEAIENAVAVAADCGSADYLSTLRLYLAGALINQGRYDDALKQAKTALDLSRPCECNKCTADVLTLMTEINLVREDNDGARANIDELKALAKSDNLTRAHVYALFYTADLLAKSDPAQAHALADEALSFFDSFNDTDGIVEYHRLKATLAMSEGRLDAALVHRQACIDAVKDVSSPARIESLKRNLAETYIQAGKPKNALIELGAHRWVKEEYNPLSTDCLDHITLYAQALLADGQLFAAKERAQEIVRHTQQTEFHQMRAEAFEVIAYADRHRNPLNSDSAVKQAIAHYFSANDSESAKRLSLEFHLKPYVSLEIIAGDNERRAYDELERTVLEIVKTKSDPIAEQVAKTEERADKPDEGQGIA